MDSNSSAWQAPANFFLSQELIFLVHSIGLATNVPILIFGCFANLVNMMVFGKQGFGESINVSLFAMAVSDFGSCFCLAFLQICFYPKFGEVDTLPFLPEVCYILLSWPHKAFIRTTSIITALVVFERCLCVVMPIKIKTIITAKRVKIFVIFVYVFMAAYITPAFFSNQLGWKFNPFQNRTVLGLVYPPNRDEIENALVLSGSMVLSIPIFIFISISTAILYINLKRKAVWRQSATSGTQTQNISSKEKKISKMVVAIAIIFIVCLFPNNVLAVVAMVDDEYSFTGTKFELYIIMSGMTLFCESLNSATNIIMYYLNSSRYQTTFKEIFGLTK